MVCQATSEFTRLVYVHDAYWLRADIVQTMAEGRLLVV